MNKLELAPFSEILKHGQFLTTEAKILTLNNMVIRIVAVIAALFKDVIKKVITEKLKPLFTRLFTWVLMHLGAYNALLNNYRRTLGRTLQEVGLTRQLIGEGVDLERNYISIQISKEEYTHPETTPPIGSTPRSTATRRQERIEVHDALKDEEPRLNIVIGTACNCHGVLNGFIIEPC